MRLILCRLIHNGILLITIITFFTITHGDGDLNQIKLMNENFELRFDYSLKIRKKNDDIQIKSTTVIQTIKTPKKDFNHQENDDRFMAR